MGDFEGHADIETGADTLLSFLEEKTKWPVSKIADDLGVPEETVKKWAKALEKSGLVDIKYSAIKGMVLEYSSDKTYEELNEGRSEFPLETEELGIEAETVEEVPVETEDGASSTVHKESEDMEEETEEVEDEEESESTEIEDTSEKEEQRPEEESKDRETEGRQKLHSSIDKEEENERDEENEEEDGDKEDEKDVSDLSEEEGKEKLKNKLEELQDGGEDKKKKRKKAKMSADSAKIKKSSSKKDSSSREKTSKGGDYSSEKNTGETSPGEPHSSTEEVNSKEIAEEDTDKEAESFGSSTKHEDIERIYQQVQGVSQAAPDHKPGENIEEHLQKLQRLGSLLREEGIDNDEVYSKMESEMKALKDSLLENEIDDEIGQEISDTMAKVQQDIDNAQELSLFGRFKKFIADKKRSFL